MSQTSTSDLTRTASPGPPPGSATHGDGATASSSFATPAAAVPGVLLRRSVPYLLLAVACALSVAASWYLSSTAAAAEDAKARSEFATFAQLTGRQIHARVNSYIEAVRAGAVLLSADNEINGAEFRRFVSGLQVRERYPGMAGIGFAQCLRRQDLRRFLRVIALDGNAVRVWPTATGAEACPTVFLEPSGNRSALGFDLGSHQALREAMRAARDSSQPVASRKLTDLDIWRSGGATNIVLVLPVYRSLRPPPTVEARRRALVGYVFSPLNSQRLLESVLPASLPAVRFDVFDEVEALPANSLAGSNTQTPSGRYRASETLALAGREWLFTATSTTDPSPSESLVARQALLGGLVLSLMLFLVTRAQVRAWETAARHEAALSESAIALRNSEAQARAANRAKDEFLATLSHELRTPLNVVLGWVSMLRQDAVPRERIEHALEIVERNARQQSALIDDLLDVSRIVTGNVRLQVRPVALGPLAVVVTDSLRPGADAKGVALHASSAGLPASSVVLGDADRLRQTVWNLISNAIKFTPAGGSVWVELTAGDGQLQLSVRDTGIGIAPEFLPHVFERFQQGDSSTTRAHGGLGLGLAIARNLIERHGGRIEAHSEGAGRGAHFVITLPTVTLSQPVTPAMQAASVATPHLKGVRVLVVDDDPSTLELLTTALCRNGAEVTAADSARDALERLDECKHDVIVSDIAMPGEDGLWLMQHIRRLPGELGRTPALALSALTRGEDRDRALQAGFQLHLTKPAPLHDIHSAVATLAASRVH